MNNKTIKTLLLVTSFSIAMGFLESAVVVYLREIYYPNGFCFPMKIISNTVAITEFLREIATIIMLLCFAIIAGKTKIEKFAFFIFSFAIWDIFYYLFLKLLIAWPVSFLDWDILFLIPFTWVGPVIAPIINSITMIILTLIIIYFAEKRKNVKINFAQWILLIIGSFIVIFAYTEEYMHFMMQYFSFTDLLTYSDSKKILEKACQFVPQHFKWFVFSTGVAFHLVAICLFYLQKKSAKI